MIVMDKNSEKEIEELEDKINFLKNKRDTYEKQLQFNMLEVKRIDSVIKRANKNIATSIVMVGMISAAFIINGLPLIALLVFLISASSILIRHHEQNKMNKYVFDLLKNNKLGIMELEKVCDDIEECNLKLKKLKNDDIDKKESITRGVLTNYITQKEELSYQKVKKIGGQYGK